MENTTTENAEMQASANKPSFIMSWSPVLLIVGLLGLYYVTSKPSLPPEGWGNDYRLAVTEAAKTDRQVVVAFYMEGCPPCTAMDRTVLRSPAVIESLNNFVPVRIDVNRDFQLANQFGVYATPTYIVLDKNEKLIAKCEGMQPTEAFVQFLARATVANPAIKTSRD